MVAFSCLLYAFFWVIPRCLNFICHHFRTLCLLHLHRWVGMKNDWAWKCWGIYKGKGLAPKKKKNIYIYIISRHSWREHRALTKFRHLAWLLASTLTSFHVLPWCLISSKIVLRHVVQGLPWDLVPEGSILRLLLLCHLVVSKVCSPATPTSSAEFLVQLAFA